MDLTTPLISIVLPTYNGARFLAESIQSCIDQTYTNWELIIVDDCSTDSTSKIIKHFESSDLRIRAFHHEKNRKLPAALNTGFSMARGDYFTWTSDDNRYRPEAISMMVEFLIRQPWVGVVYSDYTKFYEGDGRTLRVGVQIPSQLAFDNCIGPCFLYRKKVAEDVGPYDQSLFLAEDYDFWLRASLVTRLEALHEDLYLYRYHSQTLTATRKQFVQTMAAQSLSLNLPKMTWLPKQAQANGYIRLYHSCPFSEKPLTKLNYLLSAAIRSPSIAIRETIVAKFRSIVSNR